MKTIDGYQVEIVWSEEDQAFLISFPELANECIMPCSHGDTYEEALANAKEALEVILMPDMFHPPLQIA